MDYNRLTSFLLLLVEFLKNRFLNRISNQFSWQFSRFRTLVTGKEAQRASPFRDESNSSSTYCHKFEATILFSPFIQPCHVSEKRKKNPLTTVTFNRPLPLRQRNSSLFQAHARKRVALLIDTWLNDHLKRGNVLTRAMIYDPWRRPMLRRGE